VISEEIKRLNETLSSYAQKEDDIISLISAIRDNVNSIKSDSGNMFGSDVEE
jgi:hypothetical protein